MTDILIKSFNRPHYLDRCLISIQKYVEGEYKITVLDDGTPKKYLDKIKNKFPEVEIRLSDQYPEKIKAIQANLDSGKEIDGFQIPISLWKEAVKESSDYFILTEDDVWFTEKINVDELEMSMREYDMVLIKLGWVSNKRIKSDFDRLNKDLTAVQPRIFSAPRCFLKEFIFQKKWKVYSLLYRMGIVDKTTMSEYWTMNALLMGMYRKDYWLTLWNTLNTRVDEQEQLLNAIEWYRKHKRPNLYGKLNFEMMKTTFQSSATNSYHKYGNDFDVNTYNFIMNEEWYHDKLDAMTDFPLDFSESTISTILKERKNQRATPEAWKVWSDKFKDQYRKQGVIVD